MPAPASSHGQRAPVGGAPAGPACAAPGDARSARRGPPRSPGGRPPRSARSRADRRVDAQRPGQPQLAFGPATTLDRAGQRLAPGGGLGALRHGLILAPASRARPGRLRARRASRPLGLPAAATVWLDSALRHRSEHQLPGTPAAGRAAAGAPARRNRDRSRPQVIGHSRSPHRVTSAPGDRAAAAPGDRLRWVTGGPGHLRRRLPRDAQAPGLHRRRGRSQAATKNAKTCRATRCDGHRCPALARAGVPPWVPTRRVGAGGSAAPPGADGDQSPSATAGAGRAGRAR